MDSITTPYDDERQNLFPVSIESHGDRLSLDDPIEKIPPVDEAAKDENLHINLARVLYAEKQYDACADTCSTRCVSRPGASGGAQFSCFARETENRAAQ